MSENEMGARVAAVAGIVIAAAMGASGACVLPGYEVATSSGGSETTTTMLGGGGSGGVTSRQGGTGGAGAAAGGSGGADLPTKVAWVVAAGSDKDDDASAVASNPSNDKPWAGGSIGGNVTFSPTSMLKAQSPPDEYSLFLSPEGEVEEVVSYGAAKGGSGAVSVRAIHVAAGGADGFAMAIRFTGQHGIAETGDMFSSHGLGDHIILRRDGGGQTWAAHLADTGDMDIAGLAITSDGDVIAAGTFSGSATLAADASGAKAIAVTSAGEKDVFVVRLSVVDGGAKWVRTFGGAGVDVAAGLVVEPAVADDLASVWVAGHVSGPITTDLGAAVVPVFGGGRDAFVVGLGAGDGTVKWAKLFGDEKDQAALGLARTAPGTLAVAGEYDGAIALVSGIELGGDPAVKDLFLGVLDEKTGAPVSSGLRIPDVKLASRLALVPDAAPDTGLTMAGSAGGTVKFGDVAWTANGIDAFVTHLDSAHTVTWCEPLQGPGTQRIDAAAGGPDGAVFVAGSFSGDMTYGSKVVPKAGPDLDLFVMKLQM